MGNADHEVVVLIVFSPIMGVQIHVDTLSRAADASKRLKISSLGSESGLAADNKAFPVIVSSSNVSSGVALPSAGAMLLSSAA